MRAIGDKTDLQHVLDAVRDAALKTCGPLAPPFIAANIVEHTKIELIKRGLFVNFDGPPADAQPSFAELATQNRAEGGCGCAPGTILCPH